MVHIASRSLARRRSLAPSRAAGRGLVALVAAVTLLASLAAGPAQAADDALRLAVATTYRVDPAGAVVHVTLDVRATNLKPSTATTFFYFDTLSFGIQPEARSISATQNGRTLSLTARTRDGYRQVVVKTPRLLFRQPTLTRIAFDLPSGEPRSDSTIRVGRAHTRFPVWAWGDTGLADVRVILPRAFAAEVQSFPLDTGQPLHSSPGSGQPTYVADDIEDPNRWHATVDAANRNGLTDVRLDLPDKAIAIHAWPEDTEWLDRVTDVLETGLPDLETAIGLPWPVTDELSVSEVSTAAIEGYAGLYDSADDEIRISEELDEQVIVHEAAHAWFDGGLFAQRWISEGLADEYAARVVAANAGTVRLEPPPIRPLSAGAFRLNAWPPPSRIDTDTRVTESFGYDASWTVIAAIVAEVGEAGMRDVFEAAAARRLAYAGEGPAETTTATTDWRRFLDLVEELGGATTATGLFEGWIVTDDEATELTERTAARAEYAALLEDGGTWRPGILVRKPMSAWQFDTAHAAMALARTVLADRTALEAATDELRLPFPTTLEGAYEGADSADDLELLDARLDAWLTAAAKVRTARDALVVARAPLVELGLIGTEPDTAYRAALAAFAAGDDAAAVGGSSATLAVLAGAEEIGRGRALAAGTGAIVVVVLLVLAVAFLVSRSRRRRSASPAAASPTDGSGAWPAAAALSAQSAGPAGPAAPASPADPAGPAGPAGPGADTDDSYATLAATPGPADGTGADGGAEPD